MIQQLVFREMKEEDLLQVAAIEQQVFSRPWTKQDFLDSLRMQDTKYLIAELADTWEIIGYCGFYQSFEEAEIVNVAVKSSCRRQGAANRMLRCLIETGKGQGVRTFVLEVRVSNKAAIRLYEQNGFEMAGRRKDFYTDPKEDAYIMVLHLGC